MLLIGLLIIVLLVLFLPVTVPWVEKNLEVFLMLMGLLAVTLSDWLGPDKMWTAQLLAEAVKEPVKITVAVIIVGLLIHFFNEHLTKAIAKSEKIIGERWFCFFLIFILGLLSSVI